MFEFYTDKNHIANKIHICQLCNKPIYKGELYNRFSGKYQKQMFDYCYHISCKTIMSEYCSEHNTISYNVSDNVSDIDNWLKENYCNYCNNISCNYNRLNCPIIIRYYI